MRSAAAERAARYRARQRGEDVPKRTPGPHRRDQVTLVLTGAQVAEIERELADGDRGGLGEYEAKKILLEAWLAQYG